jgi:hypothetical protein
MAQIAWNGKSYLINIANILSSFVFLFYSYNDKIKYDIKGDKNAVSLGFHLVRLNSSKNIIFSLICFASFGLSITQLIVNIVRETKKENFNLSTFDLHMEKLKFEKMNKPIDSTIFAIKNKFSNLFNEKNSKENFSLNYKLYRHNNPTDAENNKQYFNSFLPRN